MITFTDDTVRELLDRSYGGGGSTVTNCVAHMHLDLTKRPSSCALCASDVSNTLARAIGMNEWLNDWKTDATALLLRLTEDKG